MTANSLTPPSFVAYVGIDWADRHHTVHLLFADGRERPSVVEQTPQALADWIAKLRQTCGSGPIAVALEQSRGALVAALVQYEDLVLFPINPKQLSRFRDAFHPSGSKGDPDDARLLARFVRDHHTQLRPLQADDAVTRELASCCEARRKLVDEKKRVSQRLLALLKTYYPLAVELLGDRLAAPLGRDFLMRWPSHIKLQRAHPDHLRKFFREHNCRSKARIEERITAIRQTPPLTRDQALILPAGMMAKALVGQLRGLAKAIAEFDQRIEQLMSSHPQAKTFQSLPGAGAALAPRLLVAMGSDVDRYEKASQVQALSGIAPVTKQSGRSKVVQRRRACPKYLRQTFHEFADHARLFSDWSRAYYRMQRERGKRHHAAVRALAFKWIRIILPLWKSGQTYDEATYLQQLRKKNSPLLKYLPAT